MKERYFYKLYDKKSGEKILYNGLFADDEFYNIDDIESYIGENLINLSDCKIEKFKVTKTKLSEKDKKQIKNIILREKLEYL